MLFQRGGLLQDFVAQFHTHRPAQGAAEFPGFACDEILDCGEVIEFQTLDVIPSRRTAVSVDWIDLHPQAVVPVSAARLGQPGAD